MTRWRAPGRVNVIGEHTDYNDGFVLPIALPVGVTAAVTDRTGDALLARSTAEDEPVEIPLAKLEPGAVEGWAAYVAGVVWALRGRGSDVPAVEIALDGDVPYGAGLSSSAALECAVATALNDHLDLGLARETLIEVTRSCENDFVGVPTGALDQSASLLCEAGAALLLDCRSGERRQVPLDLDAAGLALLVVDTRAPHRLVDGEYARRRADCAEAARRLGVTALRDVTDLDAALARLDDDRLRRRVRHVVTENARVLDTVARLDDGGPIAAIGPLLSASHASLRDDYEVSSRELDVAVEAALGAGAHGARMTGGGFGGSAIALVDAGDSDDVTAAVERAFAAAGLAAPAVFTAVPSAGARRV
ncbi:galactokinase [Jatrophihabitans endophyticus]|uniref:galactokinase n=1 Tax=Jatrophihabitans endophyticus TaxID=1206085 RepID=UPI001F2D54C8|nr:galactokinase [Jatrophihabitans endophyticus]